MTNMTGIKANGIKNSYRTDKKNVPLELSQKLIIPASMILRNGWLGSKLDDSKSRNPFLYVQNQYRL